MRKWIVDIQKTTMDEEMLCKRTYENWIYFEWANYSQTNLSS